ncbi:MAG TPA: hypothetical protein VNO50_21280 [Pyrinomonadaceae bacterium]|nr:hypothetical protein [Pyrinomonadaceae bacterium]
MKIKLVIALTLLVGPAQLFAQTASAPRLAEAMKDTASAELEAVLAEAGKLDDKLAMVSVKAKAAALIALSDPVRSELLFREVWKFTKEQTDDNFDNDRALAIILKAAYPRNPKLAKQLIAEDALRDPALSRSSGPNSDDNRRTKLASHLIEDNPRAASGILEDTLARGVTPAGLGALLRLREKNALLADFVVSKSMEGLRLQPDIVSLSGLNLLSVYLFPEGNNVELNLSLEGLQFQYFSTSYEVLRASLAKTEENLLKERVYTKSELQRRNLYQGQLCLALAALAPRIAPNLIGELNGIATKLTAQLPPNVAQLAKLTSSRLSGDKTLPEELELAIPLAIQGGDYDEAARLIGELKSDEMKSLYSQILLKAEARQLLSAGGVSEALTRIRKMEDVNSRLVFYLEALKATDRKKDSALSSVVINEARAFIPQVDRNGLHVRTLLAFASQPAALASTDEALGFLNSAVVSINSLSKTTRDDTGGKSALDQAWAEVNDLRSFLDLPEFAHAFSATGLLDLERTIIEARKIGFKSVQLVARLEAAGEVLRVDARRPKPKATSKTVNASR